jgi:hypothetical protein
MRMPTLLPVLRDGRPFLVGGRLTTADMLLTTCLTWAVSYQVPITAACHAYMERITSRPASRASVAANTPSTAQPPQLAALSFAIRRVAGGSVFSGRCRGLLAPGPGRT